MTEPCEEPVMRSLTGREVAKWSRRKDRYIGRLYSDIGKVPSDSGIFRSTGELQEFVLGLNGPYGKGEKGLKGGRAPSPWTGPNWTRERGRPLPSFSFSLPLFLFHVGGQILLGLGSPSRTPHLGAPYEGRPPPPSILYIRGQGAPHRHKLILSRVRCPSPQLHTSVISL